LIPGTGGSIEIMKGSKVYMVLVQQELLISLKKAGKKTIAGNGLYEYRDANHADRTNYRPRTTIRLSVNGNLDKFYYASLNSTETTGISEAAVAQLL
jgi:vitamin B12 transporter